MDSDDLLAPGDDASSLDSSDDALAPDDDAAAAARESDDRGEPHFIPPPPD